MQMESRLGNGNFNHNRYTLFSNHDHDNNYQFYCNGDFDRSTTEVLPLSPSTEATTSFLPPPTSSSAAASAVSLPVNGVGFIEHHVSRFDTLAGVAIKYGVEVADIKKMNGLVTDLQMFALKSLLIPLPGRHPPSAPLLNGSDVSGSYEHTPPHRMNSDLFESFQSLGPKSSQHKVSSAMSSLQGYYGLKPRDSKSTAEGFEMAACRKGNSHYLEDYQRFKPSPASHPPLSRHRKSRSLVNCIIDEINGESDNILFSKAGEIEAEKCYDKLVRRRQKSDADFTSSQEMLMREDNSNNISAFSAITGKGLALRQKAASRATASPSDSDARGLSPITMCLDDSFVVDGFSVVRKSSSTSKLDDQEGSSSSIWPTSKWNLKPDLQAVSAAAITRPIFDGLPKPMANRRNKAALD